MRGEGLDEKGKTMAHDAPQATGPTRLVIRHRAVAVGRAGADLDADTIVQAYSLGIGVPARV
jgi:hypothetical protein